MNISPLKKLLNYGSQKAPALIDDVAEELNPLATKIGTEATEVASEVLGKGSRASSIVNDIPEAELVAPKVSTIDAAKELIKENPKGWNAAKAAGATGIVAFLAGKMLGDEDQPSPLSAPIQAKEKEAEKEVPEIKPLVKKDPVKTPEITPAPQVLPTQPAAPQEETPNFLQMLKEGQEQTNNQISDANLIRHAEKLGAGLARVSADHGSSDTKRKEAERFTEQAKGKVGAVKEQQTYDKARAELGDDSKMRDPNSEVSKLTSELAAKAGLISAGVPMSAMALKNAGVNLGNLLTTIEAGKARKEAAQLQREYMEGTRDESNKLKVAGAVDRQVSQLLKSKDYEAYNAAKDAQFALSGALDSNDNKIKAGAAFMQYAKTAQGDNSVVRDGDMAQLAGRYNFTSVTDMFDKLKARAAGGNFGKSELQAMKEVAALTQKIKGDRVKQLVSPIVERAGARGIDLSEHLDPAVVAEFTEGGMSKSTGTQYSPKEEAGIVNYAKAKGISRDEAIRNLKAGGRIK